MVMAMVMAMASDTAKTLLRNESMQTPRLKFAVALKLTACLLVGSAAFQAWDTSNRASADSFEQTEGYKVYPDDAQAASAAFAWQLEQNSNFTLDDHDVANARSALVRRPLSATLLSFLAVRSEKDSDTVEADQIMRLADRVTRRDIIAQLWLIERAVTNGDVTAAVRHYNAAMSINPELTTTLIPIIASAISSPEVRSAIRPYIAQHAIWGPALVEKVSEDASAQDIGAFAILIAQNLSSPEYTRARSAIIMALALNGKADLALSLASKMIPDITPSAFRNFAMSASTVDPRMGSLACTMPQTDLVSSSLGEGGVLAAEIRPLGSGTLATRDILVHPKAKYQFLQTLSYAAATSRAQMSWSAACVRRAGIETVWSQTIAIKSQKITSRYLINIPEQCYLMRFTASVIAADTQQQSDLEVSDLELKRLFSAD